MKDNVPCSWKIALETISAGLAVFFISAFSFTLGWWKWGPIDQVYIPVNPEKHYAVVVGNVMMAHRQFKVTHTVDVTIHREYRKTDPTGKLNLVTLPSSQLHYNPGDYSISSLTPLPEGVKPGVYDYYTRVTWQANPFREGSAEPPVLKVEVLKETK